jgi:hypothetical protein
MTSDDAQNKLDELDALGVRLADLSHNWSSVERRLYDAGVNALKAAIADPTRFTLERAAERYETARATLYSALKMHETLVQHGLNA